jgi:hypothetical protein
MEIVIILLMGVSTIGMAFVAPFTGAFRHTRPRAGVFAASALIIMGTTGWFGSALSAVGGLNWLPRTWEWPVGTADGVITMPDGSMMKPEPSDETRRLGVSPPWLFSLSFLNSWQLSSGFS